MNASSTVNDILVQPGEWRLASAPQRLQTVLGSCVAIVLWQRAERVGGLCHFLLPARSFAHPDSPTPGGHYGEEAMHAMQAALRERGIAIGSCEASIYGGGNMFPGSSDRAGVIGQRNIDKARQLLAERGLPLRDEEVGGAICRSLTFDLASGNVQLRRYVIENDTR